MLLSVADRLLLMDVLPQQGNIVTLRVVREARIALELTPEETTAWEITQDGGTIRWNRDKALDAEIPLSEAARGIVCEALKKLNNEQKLTAMQIPLWEKFVEAPSA